MQGGAVVRERGPNSGEAWLFARRIKRTKRSDC
jgi:hypothetical protein